MVMLSLCNEVLRDLPFAEQCRVAAALGYGGLEVAPFTLADSPEAIGPAQAAECRRIAADHGLVVTGLGQDGDKLWFAHCQSPRLVDDQGIDLLEPLQRFGVLDQNTGLRASFLATQQ